MRSEKYDEMCIPELYTQRKNACSSHHYNQQAPTRFAKICAFLKAK